MSQEKKTPSAPAEFPLNQKLLDEALKLKEEHRLLKERLAKIESSQQDTTKEVYSKVHKDYVTRLEVATDSLLQKKNDIDRELTTLYETRTKIESNLKTHKHNLEELKFRQNLGEYSQAEFQSLSKIEEDKVARFEQVLSGVQVNVKRYESIFEGLEAIVEVDEWEEEAKASQERPFDEKTEPDSVAPVTSEWMESTSLNAKQNGHPQLTIVSGVENLGKSFPVSDHMTIGRSHNNQIILKDSKVSRQHAELRTQSGGVVIVDLNSSNGTLVNGHPVQEHLLNTNDEIQIGDFVLQFQQ